MAATVEDRRHAAKIIRRLARAYPDAHCSLNFHTPLELTIATILSAQCTDKRINLVTPALFAKYPTPADYATAPLEELEKDIQSTGFFRNKAKSIKGCCEGLVEEHGGKIPRDLDALVKLPGIGRKTANVILGTVYGLATGVVVDTHVTRLSRRMGLSKHKDAVKIERDLIDLIPKKEWISFSHRMILHGRNVCAARKPQCDDCPVNDVCPRVGVKS